MCVKGWKNPLYNPAGIKIITREFQHQVGPALDLRGGEKTADHVDILGNYELTVKENFPLVLVSVISNYNY
jgi:phospholipid:diacylglycerol acyltransferase